MSELVELAKKILPQVQEINRRLATVPPDRGINMHCVNLKSDCCCHAGLLYQVGVCRELFSRKYGNHLSWSDFCETFSEWLGVGPRYRPHPCFTHLWGNAYFSYSFSAPAALEQTTSFFTADVIQKQWLAVEKRINEVLETAQ